MATTRREFLATSAAVALAAALGRPRFALAWQQAQQPVFTPIRRNVGFFTMRGGTIGYLVNPNAVAVVDSQFPPEARACLDGLNSRSGNRPVDLLINTHHHGDHSGGNISFRGSAKKVVAHAKADEHMRQPPGGQPPADQLYPDTTFTDTWSAEIGDERIRARHYGRAHTSGDAVTVLERVPRDHTSDTIYIFGHANTGLPVTGSQAELARFRDYLAGVLAFVERHVAAGRTREEILAMREPLKGFESFGRFGQPGPRDALTCAYEEVTAASGT